MNLPLLESKDFNVGKLQVQIGIPQGVARAHMPVFDLGSMIGNLFAAHGIRPLV